MKAIILAGGSGSRLFPLSTDEYPKQLLELEGEGSLLQQTYKRIKNLTQSKNIVSITNIKHSINVKKQLDETEQGSIVISEPIGRNTAPAIAVALEYFRKAGSSDDIVVILPSDPFIKDTDAFIRTVKNAIKIAENGYIVTFGIKPSYPETGYGYVKIGEKLLTGFKVDRFVEKPDLKTAQQYLKEGKYYWNGGMFAGKISVLLEEFKKYAPDIYNNLDNINDLTLVYEKMPSISIDYAIMEKSDKVALVELQSDWSDLGSWQSLYDIKEKDENGNVIIGNTVLNNVKNSLIYAQDKTIAVSDIENTVIVSANNIFMTCDLNKTQNVKILYEQITTTNPKGVRDNL